MKKILNMLLLVVILIAAMPLLQGIAKAAGVVNGAKDGAGNALDGVITFFDGIGSAITRLVSPAAPTPPKQYDNVKDLIENTDIYKGGFTRNGGKG